METLEVDPVVDLLDSLHREIDHVRRTENLVLRDELQLRLYPLLIKAVETLVERIDVVYEELNFEPPSALSIDLVGRIVALLARYGDTMRSVRGTEGAVTDGARSEEHT